MSNWKFERFAIAFYKRNEKVYPCQIDCPSLEDDLVRHYYVRTNANHLIKIAESDLLTGFESDFPPHDCVDWGCIDLKDEVEQEVIKLECLEDERDDFFLDWEEEGMLQIYDR